MSPFGDGFCEEIEKNAGAITAIGKKILKNPIKSLGIGIPVAFAGSEGARRYQTAKALGRRPRLFQGGPGKPSGSFRTDYHKLFPHKRSRATGKNYKPELLRR